MWGHRCRHRPQQQSWLGWHGDPRWQCWPLRLAWPSNTSMPFDGSPYPWHQYGLWWYQESQSTNQTLAAVGPWGFCFLSLLFQQDKKHSVTCNFHSWLILATYSLALLQWRNMVSSLNIGQFCGRFNYQIIRKWFCARLSAKKLRDGQLSFLISGILALMKITIPKQNYSQNIPLWQESLCNLELATRKEKCLSVPPLLFLSQFCL